MANAAPNSAFLHFFLIPEKSTKSLIFTADKAKQ
jgi:hypothetical protein